MMDLPAGCRVVLIVLAMRVDRLGVGLLGSLWAGKCRRTSSVLSGAWAECFRR